MKRSIALIGFRSTGKTAVGRALAEETGMALRDTDSMIEERAGKIIARIFEEDGEPAFRALEAEVIAEVCVEEEVVIAAGGGAVMRRSNFENLTENCFVVLLQADVETILRRMQEDPETKRMRPALTDLPKRQEVEHLLGVRNETYRSAADIEVDTSQESIGGIVRTITEGFERVRQGRP